MALSRRPEPPAHPVTEVSFAELRGPVRDVALIEPPGAADPAIVPDLVDQLMSGDELVAAATAERRFVVRADGAPVAWCRLYAGDGIGQVEQVMTHPAHRNRGYARAVVSAAATRFTRPRRRAHLPGRRRRRLATADVPPPWVRGRGGACALPPHALDGGSA